MQKHFALITTALFLLLPATPAARADATSRTMSWTDLPEAVRKTITAQAGTANPADLERDEDEDGVSYSATITKDGNERDITVAENGRLMSLEVALEDIPASVQKSIKTALGNGTLDEVEKSFDEDGVVTYDVDMTAKSGADRDFTVAADGKMVSALVTRDELPESVRKTIDTQVGAGKLVDVYRSYEDGVLSYYVEMNKAGKDRDFSVTADGKLESFRVFPSELPPPGQKTLKEQIGGGKLIRIDKATDDSMFHVESRKDGKKFDFKIGPGGRFRGMEE